MPEDAVKLYVRSSRGAMVPLGSLITLESQVAPRLYPRYNLFPSAGITAQLVPGVSSGTVMARITDVAKRTLPSGYTFEWSGLSFQEHRASGQTVLLMVAALVFGYLFLVAQYGLDNSDAGDVLDFRGDGRCIVRIRLLGV